MEIIIENVRTFQDKHKVPIKPITILTGENSSGKSSFLACLSAVTNRGTFPLDPAFNSPPYSLGTFDTIASNFGKSDHFSLGWSEGPLAETARYESVSGAMKLCEYSFSVKKNKMTLQFNRSTDNYNVSIESTDPKKKRKIIRYTLGKIARPNRFVGSFPGLVLFGSSSEHTLAKQLTPAIFESFFETRLAPTESVSIAPIRTRPERTYDLSSEIATPEGSHIPFLLARLLRESDTSQSKKLLKALIRFGSESGLFKGIKVRNLGRKESDPFQVLANVSGKPTNLTDVGYGVSQSLPVVIESVLASTRRNVLIQQPEVHLHPKAQAALGTFFLDLVRSDHKEFVIETHSDYIVDRIRLEVAQGKIEADRISILYFERKGAKTHIFPLGLDSKGNILGAPPSYRAFFLREELDLLRRSS